MTKLQPDDNLENLYKLRIRESDQPGTVLDWYDMEIHQKISMPDYQNFTMVKRSMDQKLRLRNFGARNARIETGALVTNRTGQRGVERGPGECFPLKAKEQCPRGDCCSFRHDSNKRAKSTPKSCLPSEPPKEKDGRSTSRRRSLRGRSPSGSLLDNHAEITSKVSARDHLVIIGIFPNVISFKQNRGANSFGEKCSFAHRHVEDQPSK